MVRNTFLNFNLVVIPIESGIFTCLIIDVSAIRPVQLNCGISNQMIDYGFAVRRVLGERGN